MVQSTPNAGRLSRFFFQARNSVWLVGLVAFIFYAAVIVVVVRSFGNHDFRDFALIGKPLIYKSQASQVIKADPNYNYYETGYDGQYAYFIALDPANARYYTDIEAYRYTRILYPMLARGLALGQPNIVPITLVLINLLAITGGTLLLAAWCRRHGMWPWLALVYTFFIGQVLGFTLDVNDLLAYALIVLAVYMLDRWPRRLLLTAGVFALAALARETTLVFPAIYFIIMWFNPTYRAEHGATRLKLLLLGLIAAGPAILWQIILYLWMGSLGLVGGPGFAKFPYGGLLPLRPLIPGVLQVVQVIFVPATIAVAMVLWTFWRDRPSLWRPELWLLLVNALVFAIFLPDPSLTGVFSAGRISLGVVVASLLSWPYIKEKTWFWMCAVLWLSSTVIFALNPTSRVFH